MKVAQVTISGISNLSWSRSYDREVEKLEKEAHDDYEKRTWNNRVHINKDGFMYIPQMAFKNCVSEAAKYLSIKVSGKGNATYTKNFEAGILVLEPLVLKLKKEQVVGEWFHVPSDGKRGGGKRVWKCFPVIKPEDWGGEVVFHVLDDTIKKDVFEEHIKQAGQFIGLGRFRPRNNGFYGRFKVENIEWA